MGRDELERSIAARKAQLDALRPLHADALSNLRHYYDLELTYNSNAIEGNTLTAAETTLVVDKGIAIGGKPLRDHLEAIDHFDAIGSVRQAAREEMALTEFMVRSLHALAMRRSQPDIAGRYADQGRYVLTDFGRHSFPSPAEVPALMGTFSGWLAEAAPSPDAAFRAHRELVGIHPFNNGNGRTARLLMNLVLIRAGYPPVSIRPIDRLAYVQALQQAQAGQGHDGFDRLSLERLDATLEEYIDTLQETLS